MHYSLCVKQHEAREEKVFVFTLELQLKMLSAGTHPCTARGR